MVRILHTSDWHLGTALKGASRDADHAKFLDWLAVTLRDLAIDVLVIAGDVFDHAHPSAEATRLYYRFLRTITRTGVRHVVVVGGNHDSAARLDAPRDLLGDIGVHVVGGLDADREGWASRCVVPIRDALGRIELIVLAVPYVHEFRLGVRTVGADPEALAQGLHDGFAGLYGALTEVARGLSDTAPIVATGHLAVRGTSRDDVPLQVHLVGAEALDETIFDPRITYVALGHIHRMGRQGARDVWYAGSPVALSQREGETARHVLAVEIDTAVRVTPVRVPTFRAMVAIAGPLAHTMATVQALTWSEQDLPPFLFVTVTDAVEPQQATRELMRVVPAGVRMIDLVFTPRGGPGGEATRTPPARLADLDPEQVFRRLHAARKGADAPVPEDLLTAFREVVAPRTDEGEP